MRPTGSRPMRCRGAARLGRHDRRQGRRDPSGQRPHHHAPGPRLVDGLPSWPWPSTRTRSSRRRRQWRPDGADCHGHPPGHGRSGHAHGRSTSVRGRDRSCWRGLRSSAPHGPRPRCRAGSVVITPADTLRDPGPSPARPRRPGDLDAGRGDDRHGPAPAAGPRRWSSGPAWPSPAPRSRDCCAIRSPIPTCSGTASGAALGAAIAVLIPVRGHPRARAAPRPRFRRCPRRGLHGLQAYR